MEISNSINKPQRGFSIVEIVVVLAVLLMVASVGAFAFFRLRSSDNAVYFLQTNNGKLDLVSANIKQPGKTSVAVASTGFENKVTTTSSPQYDVTASSTYQTAILARPDWKYVALRSQREAGSAKLYVYNHKAKQLKAVDDSKAAFEFVGWLDGRLIYVMTEPPRSNDEASGPQSIKSYDPTSGTTTTITKTNGTLYPPYIVGDKLLYTVRATSNTTSKISIITADSTGKNTATLLSKDSGGGTVTNNIYAPDSVYYSVYGSGVSYYVYINGKVQPTTKALAENQKYHFYIASPSGQQTAWSETTDGKSLILVGDAAGKNAKVAATLDSGYQPYAWYGTTLLIAKNKGTALAADPQSKLYKLSSTAGDGKLVEIANYTQSAKGYNTAMAGYPGASYGYAGTFTF